jgi:hypothetical protein
MAYFPSIAIGVPFFRAYDLIDPDAAAFITAAGITDATQINAINRLVKNYKGIGDINASVDMWTGSKAIYPFVGGNASAHKFNLKDPRDLDAAFRIVFAGGVTHSAAGIIGNGTNGYGDTKVIPSVDLNLDDVLAHYYTPSTGFENKITFGTNLAAAGSRFFHYGAYNAGLLTETHINSGTPSSPAVPRSGHHLIQRTSSINVNSYRNGVLNVNTASTSSALSTLPMFILCRNNNGTPSDFNSMTMSFFGLRSSSLIGANALILYNIIQAFQTDLSRNV